ncbi:MAG: peptidoglycan-binding protein [Deltaproteobacteria bacterium]|nr:peptidoglycan-binding protein [Deltaproteobacteria bacterium]
MNHQRDTRIGPSAPPTASAVTVATASKSVRGMPFEAQEAKLKPPQPGGLVTGGPKLVEVQQKLNAEGFDCGAPDGIMGPRTRAAVVAFQRARGLVPDGLIGPATCGALGVEPAPVSGGGAQAKAPGGGQAKQPPVDPAVAPQGPTTTPSTPPPRSEQEELKEWMRLLDGRSVWCARCQTRAMSAVFAQVPPDPARAKRAMDLRVFVILARSHHDLAKALMAQGAPKSVVMAQIELAFANYHRAGDDYGAIEREMAMAAKGA